MSEFDAEEATDASSSINLELGVALAADARAFAAGSRALSGCAIATLAGVPRAFGTTTVSPARGENLCGGEGDLLSADNTAKHES